MIRIIENIDQEDFFDIYGKNINEIHTVEEFQISGKVNYNFSKSKFRGYLYVRIDAIQVLGTPDIQEYHSEKLQSLICFIDGKIPNHKKHVMKLHVIDYRMDVVVPNKQHIKILLLLYKKCFENSYRKKAVIVLEHETGIEYKNDSTLVRMYDKEAEREEKDEEIKIYEKWVLRLEVSVHNRNLNYMFKIHGIKKTIANYLTDEMYKRYMLSFVPELIYMGDFYCISLAEERISSSNISLYYKKMLKDFLILVAKDEANLKASNERKKTYFRYLKQLKELKMHPLIIDSYELSLLENPFLSSFNNLKAK
ncbi:hypothetical protein [Cellulosilyticum sp. I15G10I2]|uniref:hypothetical protein n=1 Tax=Cellulosilyticum sp. I15G10I2 TaxID=1892843 RepID=UPI00114C97C8|nr:hypothetical protein [Cellulosilyticum sp. I15G10I2]